MHDLFLLVIAVALLHVGCATSPASRAWLEVRTKHFVIISDLHEEETIELAEHLEIFRASVGIFTNVGSQDEALPILGYAFRDSMSFRPFRSNRNILGYFTPRMRGSIIAVQKAFPQSVSGTVFHEYTHYLTHEVNGLSYPKWFDEGFAEYMSALDIKEDRVWLGGHPTRVKQFGWTKWTHIREIVTADRYDRWSPKLRSMFYLESWALVRYLMHGRPERGSFTVQMKDYLAHLASGEPEEEAFPMAFGTTLNKLDRDLRYYIEHGNLLQRGVSIEAIPAKTATRVRSLTRAQAGEKLGTLALSTGRYELARTLFDETLQISPANTRALCGIGDLLKFDGRFEEALPYFERALRLAPDDALNQLDYGEYYLDLARRTKQPEKRHEYAARARKHFVKSYKLNPSLPETYAVYGSSYLLPGEKPEKGIETIEHAYSLMRSNPDLHLLLGQAYVATGRSDAARKILVSIRNSSHGGRYRAAADALIASLDGADPAPPVDGEVIDE